MRPSRLPRPLLVLGLLCHVSAWGAPPVRESAKGGALEAVHEVASLLEGSMDSSAQARADPEYRDVRMTHCRVQVAGGPESLTRQAVFLYVEQALSLALDRPYRQRFLRLTPAPSGPGVLSSVFEPAEPQALTGLCTRPAAERVIQASRVGSSDCAVLLRKQGEAYVGQTPREGCPSTWQGAVKVTSQARLSPGALDSWDQGWDAEGRQVWGARKGPYAFRRVSMPFSRDVLGAGGLEQLTTWLSGRWSTEEQARRDGRYLGYVDDFCPIRVQGASGAGELVLYVQKAAASAPAKPFRQQTVSLRARPDGTLEYRVFNDLKGRERFVGLCERPLAERTVAAEDVGEYRCSMSFRKVGEAYVGATGPEGCPGKFAGSSQATSTIVLYEDGLMLASTRAFDDKGQQVWGIAGGPFEMRRVRAFPEGQASAAP